MEFVFNSPVLVPFTNLIRPLDSSGTCADDSECFSNQCCGLNLFCVSKPSDYLCSSVGKAIGDGVRFIAESLVAFANALGVAADLAVAAAKGVYK